ncbi:MAG: polysaccharide deacetylase family protein [Burkholderiaceae bacterium]
MHYRYLDYQRKKPRRTRILILVAAAVLLGLWWFDVLAQPACRDPVYLSFDTGNMSQAERIAATLRRHEVKATFFLANEKTVRGDSALDASWAGFWRERAAEGHAFGSHTWRHGRILADGAAGAVNYRPQFGAAAGRTIALSPAEFCAELKQVDSVFRDLSGRGLDAIWRAPGGHTSANALGAARACGYAHVAWARAGFLGDELPASQVSNAALLARALADIRAGDVLMAHLGIWSRQPVWAPTLDPLIAGLKERGFCFRPLTEHPQYAATAPHLSLAAGRP